MLASEACFLPAGMEQECYGPKLDQDLLNQLCEMTGHPLVPCCGYQAGSRKMPSQPGVGAMVSSAQLEALWIGSLTYLDRSP